jgi:hypothetical protein
VLRREAAYTNFIFVDLTILGLAQTIFGTRLKMLDDVWKELEDIKGVIRIRKPKKDRQHNGHKKKDKMTNNNLQNIHIKLKIE